LAEERVTRTVVIRAVRNVLAIFMGRDLLGSNQKFADT